MQPDCISCMQLYWGRQGAGAGQRAAAVHLRVYCCCYDNDRSLLVFVMEVLAMESVGHRNGDATHDGGARDVTRVHIGR